MIDVMLAASPPTQVRPAATKFTPPKADEPEAFAADFERALKVKDQEMREADAARTASSAVNQKPARKPEHAPKAGSQGEMDKVQAAGRRKVSVPEHEKVSADTESTTEPTQPMEAGAAAVTPPVVAQPTQPAVVANQPQTAEVAVVQSVDVKAEVRAVAAQPAIAAVPPSTGTVSAAAVQPAVQAAPAAPTQTAAADAAVQTPAVQGAVIPTAPVAASQAAAVSSAQAAAESTVSPDGAKTATPASFAAVLQTAEKAAGPDQGAALQAAQTVDPKQSAGQSAAVEQSAVAGQSATAVKAAPDLAQAGAQMAGMKVLKGAEKVEAAVVSAAAPVSSASQAPTVVPQALEVKAVGGSLMATDAQTATAARPLEMMAQVARAVEASLQQGKNTLRMQLNPADLGAIDIRLVSSGHRVSMTVIAEQASTGRMLENQMEQLRQNLADAGVQLTQMHVGQQNQGSHFARSFAQQQPQNSFASARLGQQGLTNEAETADDRSARARGAGAVDYRV